MAGGRRRGGHRGGRSWSEARWTAQGEPLEHGTDGERLTQSTPAAYRYRPRVNTGQLVKAIGS